MIVASNAVLSTQTRPIGALLRAWRERRRLSQLELALRAGVSTRHLSFVETSRAKPSRELLTQLSEHLEVPLRERNRLLLAAGFAPLYSDSALDAPQMTAVREAIVHLLRAFEPYPALVIDRHWQLVDANRSFAIFTDGLSSDLLAPPVNLMRLAFHPDGLAARIVNLGEWRGYALARLRRQISQTSDELLARLEEELTAYPCAQPTPIVEIPGPSEVAVPLRVRVGDEELAFLSIVAAFGTALDVNVAELAIEAFVPADAATAERLGAARVSGR
jgi:transcriptional regulator with XRE-family HTH domain